jgi:hypothetical protein
LKKTFFSQHLLNRHVMEIDFQNVVKSLLAIAGAGALFYQAAAAFYQGAPLRMVVNPYRRQWLIAGLSMASVAYSGIALTADNNWDPISIVAELKPLVTEGKTPLRVVVGSLFLLLGMALMGSVAYCWWMFPRDPKSFDVGKQPPDAIAKNVNRALRHYVSRPGGMEYAAVIVLPPAGLAPMPTVEELIASETQTGTEAPAYRLLEWLGEGELKGIRRRRKLTVVDHKVLAADRAIWLKLALEAHPRAREEAIPCLQSNLGDVTLLQTRSRFGGYLFEYLYPAKDGEPDFLLFGVTMNSGETDDTHFYEHFAMLRQAVRYLMPDKQTLGPTVFPTELAVSAAPPPSPPPPVVADVSAEPVEPEKTEVLVATPKDTDNPATEAAALVEPPTATDPVI